jgi:hypothetical protein
VLSALIFTIGVDYCVIYGIYKERLVGAVSAGYPISASSEFPGCGTSHSPLDTVAYDDLED